MVVLRDTVVLRDITYDMVVLRDIQPAVHDQRKRTRYRHSLSRSAVRQCWTNPLKQLRERRAAPYLVKELMQALHC
jgi:hypothetical protein